MFGLNPRFGSGFEVSAEAFVLEGLDHRNSIARCAPRNKTGEQTNVKLTCDQYLAAFLRMQER